jgi:putative ABC transport system permease protein
MRSVLLTIFANLRQKKGQNILLMLMIAVTALLLSTSIAIFSRMKQPFEAMMERAEASQLLLMFDSRVHDVEDAADWWRSQPGVIGVQVLPYYEVKSNLMCNGKRIKSMVNVSERPFGKPAQDQLQIATGKEQANPGFDEVWLPTTFAAMNGIKVGDTVSIPTENGAAKMKVSAIVVDPQFSSPLMNPSRIWVAPGKLSQLFPFGDLSQVTLGVRFADYQQEPELWRKFQEFLQKPFLGYKLDYQMISTSNLFLYTFMAMILIFFAAVIVITILFIITNTVSGAILNDYKTIGILKSQGFTPGNITAIYAGQFVVLSVIAIPLGILASYLTTHLILTSLLKLLGTVNLSLSMWGPASLTFVILMIAITLAALASAQKAGKVKPTIAIRTGAPPQKLSSGSLIKIASFKKLSVPVILGIKQVFSQRRKSFFLFLTTLVTVFVLAFSVNLYASVFSLGNNGAYWGWDNAQIRVTRLNVRFHITHEELMKQLTSDHRIQTVIPYNFILNAALPAVGTKAPLNLVGMAFDGDMDQIGMLNLEGCNPRLENEIAIAINTSKAYQKKCGDYLDLYLEGKRLTFLITGIYQSTNNMGQGFRIQYKAVKNVNPVFEPLWYAVNPRTGVKDELLVRELKKRYGSVLEVKLNSEATQEQVASLAGNIAGVVALLGIIFGALSFIIVFNGALMNIYEQKRDFGIFKTTGMTSAQMRWSIIYRIELLTGLSCLLGIPLALFIAPPLLGIMLSGMGIVKFPFVVSMIGTGAIVPLGMLLTGLAAWIPAGKIMEINPRTLIQE